MTQGETPLLLVVVGPHNIRRQHSLMLWWVLLCDYCSSFCHLPKTSELGRAINAHIIVAAYYSDHCLVFRVCSIAELSSAFIIYCPWGRCSCLHQHFRHLFSELHHTSMGHARLVCTQLYIVFFLSYTSLRRSRYQFLFPPTDHSEGSHYLLSLTTTFSVEETLMDFGYTYAPNLIHQGASVITEILSTQGDKNSASSTQQWSHSWHRMKFTAFQKSQKL